MIFDFFTRVAIDCHMCFPVSTGPQALNDSAKVDFLHVLCTRPATRLSIGDEGSRLKRDLQTSLKCKKKTEHVAKRLNNIVSDMLRPR